MKIKSISIGGFKNLKQTRIEVDRIIALVSPNNYGKSNFLQGIDFALTFLSAGEKSRKKMTSWKKGIPLNPNSADDPFFFEVEFHEPSLGEYQYVRYGFSFIWMRDDASGQRITDEWLEMRESESVKYTRYLKRNEGHYRKAKSTNAFRNITLGDYQLAVDTLSSIDDIAYTLVLDRIKHLSFKTCSSLDMDTHYQDVPFELDEPGIPLSYTNDIPKLLNALKETNPERFSLFKEAITTLFPEITDVEVVKARFDAPQGLIKMFSMKNGEGLQSNDKEVPPFKWKNEIQKIFVTNKHMNQPMDITMLSAGTKRLFWIMTILFSSNSDTHLIGIEELETSIHPRLLKQTLELLNEHLGDISLLITSHSPYLVQYLKLERIYIGLPDETGLASFQNIAKSKAKSLVGTSQDLGLSVGEYLFDLMAGDSKSSLILKHFIKG
ncbi:Predicted ATPase [Sphaerochaeta associata]|uniref:ATP-binding protein n=1 Tax=Sphaerochaeta associata TaxID=1129264 RepID=A0ABY4DBU5_9SPIR|nr:ATP-binding protein [Sphaerochaeta associata]UOM51490.1 ATP-binding protein [Sphaerochaeta associata]SMP61701.1 Predicted ATPase [Sphaerochaeta associata]